MDASSPLHQSKTRFLFVTGGVVSSLGKGIASAALASLLQARGYKLRIRKLDPYLNVDPGTMSPYQHGEVFVTNDGAETDLDLGHYERFTGVDARQSDNITAGRIYQNVLTKERRGDYLGGTVQVIPHVTNEIKDFVTHDIDDLDFLIVEIGGTVGDIEGLPFFEAIRQLGQELGRERSMFVHLTLMPFISTAGELKTKPTQHSVKELRSIGIQPDLLMCRSDRPMPEEEKRKIALFCNVRPEAVVNALDVETIYEVPLRYHEAGLDQEVLRHFRLGDVGPNLDRWQNIITAMNASEGHVRVAIVGKYTGLPDAYKSLIEALRHGGIANNVHVEIVWKESEIFEHSESIFELESVDAILVPGGFGERGSEGKIEAVKFAREKKVPFLGICFGMQMAVVEAARNLAGLHDAGSTEFGPCGDAVVGLMTEWTKGNQTEQRGLDDDVGGTMRLGSYTAHLRSETLIQSIYQADIIDERHRHRFEVNAAYANVLEQAGLVISGWSPDGKLPETIEYQDHPWFVGVQYHPELKSRPFAPHPLFSSFIAAALDQSRLV